MKRWSSVAVGLLLLLSLCACTSTGAQNTQQLTQSAQQIEDADAYNGEAFPVELPKKYQSCEDTVLKLSERKAALEEKETRMISYGGEIEVVGVTGALLDVYQSLPMSSNDSEYLLVCSVAVCPSETDMQYYWYNDATQSVTHVKNP